MIEALERAEAGEDLVPVFHEVIRDSRLLG
jgi:hypothetical protein